ncbi:MAG: hypothetical protein ACE5J3_00925 [Methanosarcinales archaeon]
MEDVTTTGNSLVNAINTIREENGIVEFAIVVVDREEEALKNLKNNGVELIPLLTISDLFK